MWSPLFARGVRLGAAADRPWDFLLKESTEANRTIMAWRAEGVSDVAIDQRFKQEAWRLIREHPIPYLAQSGLEWLKGCAFSYLPVLNEPRREAAFQHLPSGRAILAVLRGLLRLLAFPILAFALFGAYVTRAQWQPWVWIALPIITVMAVHGLFDAHGRYAVPLVPLYLLFAAAGWRAWREQRIVLSRG